MEQGNAQVSRIFEYLLAVKNLNEKIIRNISEYEKVWWEHDLPIAEGCYLFGNGTNQDAWLEVHKQEIPTKPGLPTILQSWVKQWGNPDQMPEVISTRSLGKDEEGKEVFEQFEEDKERVSSYNEWIELTWKPWAEIASPKVKIQTLYTELFALHQRFQREGDNLELAWGHGFLQWFVQNELIGRHLLITRLELSFDAKKGIFSILPTSKGTVLEADMLQNIDFPNASRLTQMENQLSNLDFSPEQEEIIQPLLKEIAFTISPNGSYQEKMLQKKSELNNPVISFSSALLLRQGNTRLWQRELTNAVEKIKEGYRIPETIQSLISTSSSSAEAGTENQSGSMSEQWTGVGEDLLFPLPTNSEQKLIAQKLANNPGVVVQGPPGTGKSHTIANLISHLLAHGKRILVTSEKERALQVLRDKIPQEIRALCVSVLGGDSKSVKEIEDSVKQIAENLDSKQPELLQKNIDRLRKEFDLTRRNIAKYKALINQTAQQENLEAEIEGEKFTPLEGAKYVASHINHNWLPDHIDMNMTMPLTEKEMKQFFELLNLLTDEDIQSLEMVFPSSENLPSYMDLKERFEELAKLELQIKEREKFVTGWNLNNISNLNIKEMQDATEKSVAILTDMKQEIWLNTILEESLSDPERKQYWEDIVSEIEERVKHIQSLYNQLLEHEVNIPENKHLTTLKEELLVIKERLAQSKSIGWMFKNIIGRKYTETLENCKVDNLPIRNVEDVNILINYIEQQELKEKLTLKWNRIMEELEGPVVKADQARFAVKMQELLRKLNTAIGWKENLAKINEYSHELGVPGSYDWSSVDFLQSLVKGMETLQVHQQWQSSYVLVEQTQHYLKNGVTQSSHPYWTMMLEELNHRNVEQWKERYEDIKRLESLREPYKVFQELKDRMLTVLPKWTQHLLTARTSHETVSMPEDFQQAWMAKKVDTWLRALHAEKSMEELEAALQLEVENEKKLIKELVAESTWKEQIERTTKAQKASLFAWMKTIQRIGKGTGKYANAYRKQASQEMKIARDAIPVWIMPINRVIENIELTNELFDVVIVDESSQSDLFSLSALLRAKKAVIVGDDNQISPESVGTDISEVHQLIDKYLFDIPNAKQFEMKTSLYDTAIRVFDSKIILKEHFRCVPEIIQFSNDLMYGGLIDPLRLPNESDMLHPPVQAIRVLEGYRKENTSKAINEPEAEAIVEHIAKCCEDTKYQGKTIGVISLQGHDQARVIENMLRERIGEEEMINRNIICGDSYSFQGDERDVIFLSMVTASNVRFGSLVKRSDYQRFNVAASRARDQMFLFHSVDLNELNPDCARFRLLQYCLNPYRVQLELEKAEEEFDSDFEREVFKLIAARGYRVIPQVKVGTVGKRIDLVVEGMRSRLAVECDGDRWHGLDKWEEDMDRQRVLERVGWTFWRVRGSEFYQDPHKAMSSLWKKLDEMNIQPVTYDNNQKSIELKV